MNYNEIRSIAFGDNREDIVRKALLDMYRINNSSIISELKDIGLITDSEIYNRFMNDSIEELKKDVLSSEYNTFERIKGIGE